MGCGYGGGRNSAHVFSVIFYLTCLHVNCYTVMVPSFQTDRSGQTVWTQIKLLLSDQGPHCLPVRLYLLDPFLYGKATLFTF